MNDDNTSLKITLYDFCDEANAFLGTDYNNVADATARFLGHIEGEPLIKEFLDECVQSYLPEGFDADAEVEAVSKSLNTIFGNFAHTFQGESAQVYLILRSMTAHDSWRNSYLFYGYGHGSNHFNDMVSAFQNEVSRRLVNGIERHLKRIGMQRGLGDAQVQQINASGGSTVVAAQSSGNSAATATQTNNGIDAETLSKLTGDLTASFDKLTEEQRQEAENYASALKDELADEKPKSKVVKMLLKGLKGLSTAAEFVTTVKAIQDFVIPLLPA